MVDLTKPCIKCGAINRHEKEGYCVPCRSARGAAYYKKNKEKLDTRSRNWRIANLEKSIIYTQRWRDKNPNYCAPKNLNANNLARIWREKNKKSYSEYQKQWVEKNKDKTSGYYKIYAEKNKEKMLNKWSLNHARRRALKNGSDGKLSSNIKKMLWNLQKGKCACCGKNLPKNAHLDHIMPLALGGQNIDRNMQLLFPKCNLVKNAKHPVDYMREKGLLL